MADTVYPYTAFNFLLTIDTKEVGGFSEVSGLSTETDVIDYREGNEQFLWPRKLSGLAKFTNIVLKRGFINNTLAWDLRNEILTGERLRYTGSIALMDEKQQPVLRWSFSNAWVAKLEGPSLNAKNSEVAIETMELVVERWEFATEG